MSPDRLQSLAQHLGRDLEPMLRALQSSPLSATERGRVRRALRSLHDRVTESPARPSDEVLGLALCAAWRLAQDQEEL